jgi:hypothetical protein
MGYSFNGATKLITLTAGTTSVSVRDLWSRWADWVALSDNAKFLPAFSQVGGQTIDAAAGTYIPIYAFLLNGWRIRPQEANHTLNINDGVLLVDGGGDPFVNTVGSFVVRIVLSQPVQAITVATGGSSVSESAIATAVWARIIESGYSAEELLRLTVSTMVAKATGGGSTEIMFGSLDGTKNRFKLNIDDQNGNRSAPTIIDLT